MFVNIENMHTERNLSSPSAAGETIYPREIAGVRGRMVQEGGYFEGEGKLGWAGNIEGTPVLRIVVKYETSL